MGNATLSCNSAHAHRAGVPARGSGLRAAAVPVAVAVPQLAQAPSERPLLAVRCSAAQHPPRASCPWAAPCPAGHAAPHCKSPAQEQIKNKPNRRWAGESCTCADTSIGSQPPQTRPPCTHVCLQLSSRHHADKKRLLLLLICLANQQWSHPTAWPTSTWRTTSAPRCLLPGSPAWPPSSRTSSPAAPAPWRAQTPVGHRGQGPRVNRHASSSGMASRGSTWNHHVRCDAQKARSTSASSANQQINAPGPWQGDQQQQQQQQQQQGKASKTWERRAGQCAPGPWREGSCRDPRESPSWCASAAGQGSAMWLA